MIIFVGGLIVAILGIIGIICWWWHFVAILQGVLPIMFIFAGGLAVYLSLDQFKTWWASKNKGGGKNARDMNKNAGPDGETAATEANTDIDALRKENEELKKQLAEINKDGTVMEKTEGAIVKAKDAVKDAAKDVKEDVKNAVNNAVEDVKDAAGEVKDAFKDKK